MSLDIGKCSCQKPYHGSRDGQLEELAAIRKSCPAIKLVFLPDPDDVWSDYQKWHRQRDLGDIHQSILMVALEFGCLGRVTSAIHPFLIADGSLRRDVTEQYRKDLREKWWQASNPLERHRESRTFLGRLAELQFAERLEQRGWSIDNLEAWGAQVDIQASDTNGVSTSFEVKYIGTKDEVFKTLQEAIKDPRGISGGSLSLQAAVNYLQFRAYEAARQLESISGRRIAVIIISDWQGFDQPLADKWIDWNEPHFCRADSTWDNFLKSPQIKNKHPDLPGDLPDKINTLNEVWIMQWTPDFEFCLKYKEQTMTT